MGEGVSRSFLRALVALIGGYRDALKFRDGSRVTFDEEMFLRTRPASIQPYLREMLCSQIFQQVRQIVGLVGKSLLFPIVVVCGYEDDLFF
jgi:hypothetical protein